MKIKWFAASAFLFTSESGAKIIIDPYDNDYQPEIPPELHDEGNFMLNRESVEEQTDVVAITHAHFDHAWVYPIQGNPDVFQIYTGPEPFEIKGMKLRGVPTYHGARRGPNMVMCIEIDGVRIVHLGDLGHKLSEKQLAEIGKVDILLTPWDDIDITLPFDLLDEVIAQLNPKVIFPMHHIFIDDFIKSKSNVVNLDVSEIEFKADSLPETTVIYLLKAALEKNN